MALYDREAESLNGVSAATVTFSADIAEENRTSIVVQAQLATNATYRVYYAFDAAPTLAANDGMLLDGDSSWLQIRGYANIQFLLTNATGTATNGGANDYVLVRGSKGHQSP